MTTGTIFSIEDFAINDGPGIRTTVFLKGCPLRCAWCHNPEGQSPLPEILHKSAGDELCGREVSAQELAERLARDRDVFELNGGGVTFTGGEPMAQAEFLLDVLQRLRGVHRAVETSGFCPSELFRNVLGELDYVLFDLKLIDPGEHSRWTGVSNSVILENFRILKESGKPFVVRIPLIPGVNDSLENAEATRTLILEGGVPPGLERVEMLRYHKTAGAKYAMTGREYSPGFDVGAAPAVHKEVFENLKTIVL